MTNGSKMRKTEMGGFKLPVSYMCYICIKLPIGDYYKWKLTHGSCNITFNVH